jgi:hypothetical protein
MLIKSLDNVIFVFLNILLENSSDLCEFFCPLRKNKLSRSELLYIVKNSPFLTDESPIISKF